jgi:2-haloacid dehalogenase
MSKTTIERTKTNFNQFEVFSFDCYGTLIDWETGIINALKPFLEKNNIQLSESEILENYGIIEPEIQKSGFQNYKTVLQKVIDGLGEKLKISVHQEDKNILVDSLKDWPPFSDTVEMLIKLKEKYKLAIISNIDDDLFSFSNEHLQIEFDWIITAEQVQSYKPSLNNFNQAIKKLGLPKENILHVAQSIFHDIVPAKRVGLKTVWVNRRHNKKGFGATPEANAKPDFEVHDLKSLVEMIC